MEFRYIQYVGKQTEKRDRLYASGVVWSQYGEVQPVPAEVAPLLLRHPDEFTEVDEATYRQLVTETSDRSADTDALERARRRVGERRESSIDPDADEGGDAGAGEVGPSDSSDAGAGDEGSAKGRPPQKPEKPVSQMNKGALIDYAQREFDKAIDSRQSAENVRGHVKTMMAEHGLR